MLGRSDGGGKPTAEIKDEGGEGKRGRGNAGSSRKEREGQKRKPRVLMPPRRLEARPEPGRGRGALAGLINKREEKLMRTEWQRDGAALLNESLTRKIKDGSIDN